MKVTRERIEAVLATETTNEYVRYSRILLLELLADLEAQEQPEKIKEVQQPIATVWGPVREERP